MSNLEKIIQIRACVFTFSVKLEKWSSDVTNLPRKGKKCTQIKQAREGRAKLLFLFIKYSKFVVLPLRSRRRFYTPISLANWIQRFHNKTESSVLNNGWSSKRCSARLPPVPYLFILSSG